MPGPRPERGEILPPDGEKDAPRMLPQGVRRLFGAADPLPAIPRLLLPQGPAQGEKRHAFALACLPRVVRNPNGVGMGGIDEDGNFLGTEIGGKPLHPAETARTGGNGKRARCAGPPRPGIGHAESGIAGEALGQSCGFRRAAEEEDALGPRSVHARLMARCVAPRKPSPPHLAPCLPPRIRTFAEDKADDGLA